jgi:hypothetical protein
MRSGIHFAALVLALSACQDPDHPAPLDCPPERAPCGGPLPGTGQGHVPDRDAGTGDAQAPDAGVSLTGTIEVLPDTFEPLQAVAYSGSGRVEAEGAGASLVSGPIALGQYALDGVRIGFPVWAAAIPEGAEDVSPTLQGIDTTRGAPSGSVAELLLVRPSSIDLALSVLTLPAERLPDRAHLIVRFVSSAGAPIEGVTLLPRAGETLAYDTGQGFIDDDLGTGPRGLALLANIEALEYPGSDHVRALGGSASGEVELRLAAGAVTVQVVVLSDP